MSEMGSKTMTESIWNHWTAILIDGKKTRVECNYCKSNSQLKNAPKCKRHIIKCSKAPVNVRNRFRLQMEARELMRQTINKQRGREFSFICGKSTDGNDANDCQVVAIPVRPESEHSEEEHSLGEGETQALEDEYQLVSSNRSLQNYSSHRNKRSYCESLTTDAIVKYIDTFHRVKEDMNYLLNETTTERKREFLSFALEVISESMTEEDKIYLNQEVVEIGGRYSLKLG